MSPLHYDGEDAIAYVARQTGLPPEVAERALRAKDLYEMLIGILPDWIPDVDVRALRRVNADVLPTKPNFIDWESLTTFVARQPGLTRSIAIDCLAAEIGYLVRRGIMDPGAEEAYRAGL
jgi:hypothetical protein